MMIELAKQFHEELGITLVEKSNISLVEDPRAQVLKHRMIREDCSMGPDVPPTDQEKELYEYRRPTTIPREIVVYFIQSTTPFSWGCTYRHPMRSSILITKVAPPWTLAHEIGHIHGLTHVDDSNNLMNKNTKFSVRPYLNNAQKARVQASSFLFPL